MSVFAVGVALLLIGVSNQVPGVVNGATLLAFIGGALILAAVLKSPRRRKPAARPRYETDQDHMEVW